MKIMKFGGSSIKDPERIEKVLSIIKDTKDVKAVIFSAFGGVTDDLILCARTAERGDNKFKELFESIKERHLNSAKALLGQDVLVEGTLNSMLKELHDVLHGIFLVRESTPRTLDVIQSFGERLSCYIITEKLNQTTKAVYVDARKLIITDNYFSNAKVEITKTKNNIIKHFSEHTDSISIITGFIGSNSEGLTTTLGRGGSDYTASIVGSAIQATEIQIWTDVDGILTANPSIVKDAYPISELSYEEAMELSHFGAKVIHPPTMYPAQKKSIPIKIKNTFNPTFTGSIISNNPVIGDKKVTGISSISDIAILRIQGSGMVGVNGIGKRLFSALAEAKINVILITQASSEHTICIAVRSFESNDAKDAIKETFYLELQAGLIDPVIVEEDLSILAIVGEGMKQSIGIAGSFFESLSKNRVNIIAIAQGSSERNISVVIKKEDEFRALNAVHTTFMHKGRLSVFIIGTGVVGSELLNLINQNETLKKQIKIEGLARSKRMIIGNDNINLDDWKNQLLMSNTKFDIQKFIEIMKQYGGNKVFVDCTSSDEIVSHYKTILTRGISIVTPNKKANSGSFEDYTILKNLATQGIKFHYETNVGAGLPVISTLQDLFKTGDTITKIEAVLSGTLSYIFNNLKDNTMSAIVKKAQEKGFTEPNPKEDLNGLDVARKTLILAREIGMNIELKDITIEPLLPEFCMNTNTVEEFFESLEKVDEYYSTRIQNAKKNDRVLRYIATITQGKARIALEEVDMDHPFYSLDGADNIISFTTTRYCERPLVIKGPGAGAKVTAAGVLAEIIKVIE